MTLSELNAFGSEFKALVLAIDPLMHGWYTVHRGYDANPYQVGADVDRKFSAVNRAGQRAGERSEYEVISWESDSLVGTPRHTPANRRRNRPSHSIFLSVP